MPRSPSVTARCSANARRSGSSSVLSQVRQFVRSSSPDNVRPSSLIMALRGAPLGPGQTGSGLPTAEFTDIGAPPGQNTDKGLLSDGERFTTICPYLADG